MSDDDAPQTAMMLTQHEWEDLAAIMRTYLKSSEFVNKPRWADEYPDIARRRALANRIIDASE